MSMQTSLHVQHFLLTAFVFSLDHQHFVGIQQVFERVRPIPQLVLLPDPGHNRSEQKWVVIRRLCHDPVYFRNRFESKGFPSKKSAAPHLIAS